MTRARDELVLSHAADYGGQRARRVSPFVLEALDLPVAAGRGGGRGANDVAARAPGRRSSGPSAVPPAPRRRDDEPLVLSFYAIDDYLTCPLKYKYAHILRVPLAPHHSMIYGSALHAAVAEFHRRHARGDVMTEEQLFASFEQAWTNDGFLSREHEEARLDGRPRGAAPVPRRAARARRRDARVRRARVQLPARRRPGPRPDGPGRHRARATRTTRCPVMADPISGADVVEPMLGLYPERVVITDYKSSDVRDPAKARQRAKDSLQLSIYAMGYEAMTGRLPDAVALHFLETGWSGMAPVDRRRIDKAREAIRTVAAGIRARDFDGQARPPVVHLVRVPGDLPVQRGALSVAGLADDGPRGRSRPSSRATRRARWSRPTTSRCCGRCRTAASTSPTPTRRSRPAGRSG